MAETWNGMSTDEKFEALRDDVQSALDSIDGAGRDRDEIKKSVKVLKLAVERLAMDVYELKKKL